jgi:hypothetical protein
MGSNLKPSIGYQTKVWGFRLLKDLIRSPKKKCISQLYMKKNQNLSAIQIGIEKNLTSHFMSASEYALFLQSVVSVAQI